MDIPDYTSIIMDKIQKFEPEIATKIYGYLLCHALSEQELATLASCADHVIQEVASKAKTELPRLAAKPAIISSTTPLNPQQSLSHSSVISPRTANSCYWDNTEFMEMGDSDSIPRFNRKTLLVKSLSHIDPVNVETAGVANGYFSIDALNGNLNGKSCKRFSSVSDFSVKICHYFSKGYCRHGSSCRYYHGQVPENLSHIHGNFDDQIVSPGSLTQLEAEIVELLKLRRGNPISIASLPMAYYERYKKVLQADGYLTESQRHGKSGYSLTKLLARLKNSIRLIDRPHGQHALVLAEDSYMERGDPGQNISASRQIYLTFPPNSTFTEHDVSNYFNTFGLVEDVRIPCLEKRMFGFVTFVDSETAKNILKEENPHYVQGSRVLVKPYRERSKPNHRKYSDRVEPPVCYPSHYVDIDFEPNQMPKVCRNPRFLRRQIMEEQEHVLELQRYLAKLQLAQKSLSTSSHLDSSLDRLNVTEESIGYVLNDKPPYVDISCGDENRSDELDLPESPFTFSIDNEF